MVKSAESRGRVSVGGRWREDNRIKKETTAAATRATAVACACPLVRVLRARDTVRFSAAAPARFRRADMATLLKNVTNCVWQAFNSLDTDKSGTVVKSKLKVSNVYSARAGLGRAGARLNDAPGP